MLHGHPQQHRSGDSGGACTQSSLGVGPQPLSLWNHPSLTPGRSTEEHLATRLTHVRMQLVGEHENACRGHPLTDYPRMPLPSLNPTPSGGIGQCLQEGVS